MGCDIHLYIEYKQPDDQRWYSFGGRINPGRNYVMFGLMSKGVRTEYPESFEQRGLPDKLSWAAEDDSRILITEDGDDEYCTLEQAKRWEASGEKIIYYNNKPTFVTHPDWHSHSWLSANEFNTVIKVYNRMHPNEQEIEYEAVNMVLQYFKTLGEARIVFWFDN